MGIKIEAGQGPEGCEVSIDQITIGDVIQYETDGDKTWDHAVIVVEIQDGIPYVASHSPNFSKEPYTSFSYSDIRFIHVERLDIVGPHGFETNGILASYYNDTSTPFELDGPITWDTFTNYVLSRRESHVDFMIGDADVPPPGVNDTFWSARWEGALYVPQDGEYTFYLKNLDDGGKLYLDNLTTPVLESWKVQGFHTYSTKVPLTAGAHIVRVEFAQGPPLDYGLIVEWESDDFREKIGPYSGITLTPTPTPTATPTQTPTPVPSATSTLPPTATLIPTATPWWGWWVEAEEAALQEEPPTVRQILHTTQPRTR